MKIDTETTEPAVIRGMSATLATCRPDIVCEVLPGWQTEPQLEAMLEPLGYRFYLLTPRGLVRNEHIVGSPDDRNWLFTCRTSATLRELGLAC